MPKKKYTVALSKGERNGLQKLIKGGVKAARLILQANILLLLDTHSGEKHSVAEIAHLLNTTPTTVQNVKTSFCEQGLSATLARK